MDENDIAAKIAVDSFERAVKIFGKSIDEARRAVSVKMGAGFKAYKAASKERYGYVKTLMHRDRPISLKDLYVESRFKSGDEKFKDTQIVEKVTGSCKILIQGTAGSGKSIFLKFLNLAISNSSANVLPLYFELKSLNSNTDKTLMSSLFEVISASLADISMKDFEEFVSDGRIILLLDGFDEINFDQKENYSRQISEICRANPHGSIVISSRPDDVVASVELLSTFHSTPFEKDQALDLLSKLPYDEVARSKFISAVDTELYDKHQEFLSNPLLITMMLITYHQFAEIPNKIHIFYQQAFEALFSWHDSSKDVFKRKRYAEIPIDEFQRFFSYFCASSYTDQVFVFSEAAIRERISRAINAEIIEANPGDVLKDLMISTCLLQRDGLEIVFAHRSFQEYFAAVFISKLDTKSAKRAIDAILKRAGADLVLPMAYEMNPSLVESAWSRPTIDALIKKQKSVEDEDNICKYLSIFYSDLIVGQTHVWLTYNVNGLWSQRLRALHKIYHTNLRPMGEDACRNGFSKFKTDLIDDPGMRDKYKSASAYKVPENWWGDEGLRSFHFHFSRLDNDILKYFNVSIWSDDTKELIEQLKNRVDERVSNRKNSIKSVFG